jgi:hypothetical protein
MGGRELERKKLERRELKRRELKKRELERRKLEWSKGGMSANKKQGFFNKGAKER